MKNIFQYILICISILTGCVLGYVSFQIHSHPQSNSYRYVGQATLRLKLQAKNGVFISNKSVMSLDGGAVSDPEVAGIIGISILSDIYGYQNIAKQMPFCIEKDFHSWIISGSGKAFPSNRLGGLALICIDRKTGMVIDYSHGK